MSDQNEVRPIPRTALIGGFLLIITTIVFAAYSSFTGVGKTQITESETVEQLDLFFQDRDDGSVDVIAANDGTVLETLKINEGGFVRVVMRGMVRDRKARNVGPEVPFRLIRRADGKVMITDPAINNRIDLEPFGSNKDAFARWLKSRTPSYTAESEFSMQQS